MYFSTEHGSASVCIAHVVSLPGSIKNSHLDFPDINNQAIILFFNVLWVYISPTKQCFFSITYQVIPYTKESGIIALAKFFNF